MEVKPTTILKVLKEECIIPICSTVSICLRSTDLFRSIGKIKHFRIAGYGEWSNVAVAHDEAEPNLMDDTGGYGYGLISTLLKNRFAASVTCGIIKPNSYFETQPDFTGGPDLPTKIDYGDAVKCNLSLGYRLAPKHYTDYDQPNWNVYVEFIGKKYDAARVIQNGVEVPATKAPFLRSGSYIEIHPGIQRIVQSKSQN